MGLAIVVVLGSCRLCCDRSSCDRDDRVAGFFAELCLSIGAVVVEEMIEGIADNGDRYAGDRSCAPAHAPAGEPVRVPADQVSWSGVRADDASGQDPAVPDAAVPERWRGAYRAGYTDRWRDLTRPGVVPGRWVAPASTTAWARWYRRGWLDAGVRHAGDPTDEDQVESPALP